jgi:hypothetical protein
MNTIKTISGAQFKLEFGQLAANIKDDDLVSFGSGDLAYNRIKQRSPATGPQTYNVEFSTTYTVTGDPDGS